MIKRTLYFGNPAYISTKREQLVVSRPEQESVTVPIEDIGVVILDHYGITLSQLLLHQLMENNVAVITCNDRHMPTGMHLNLHGHTLQHERFQSQIKATEPLKKRLWKQIIQAKISNQGQLLAAIHSEGEPMAREAARLRGLARCQHRHHSRTHIAQQQPPAAADRRPTRNHQ